MQFTYQKLVILAAALTKVAAAPQSTSSAQLLTTTVTVGHTTISGNQAGAAVYLDGYSNSVVAYQAADTSIHIIHGIGAPTSATSYVDTVAIAAGIAKTFSPLALAVGHDGANPGQNQVGFARFCLRSFFPRPFFFFVFRTHPISRFRYTARKLTLVVMLNTALPPL